MSGATQPGAAAGGGTDWLPAIVPFTAYDGNWQDYEDALYAFFQADFVDSMPAFPNRRWAVKRHPESKGKACTFWHCISEGKDEEDRIPDFRRCERIRWPRPMIDAFGAGPVRCWRNTRGRSQRVLIATGDFSYLVVLEDRGSYIMLWTTYHIAHSNERRDLRRECERFERDVAAGKATL